MATPCKLVSMPVNMIKYTSTFSYFSKKKKKNENLEYRSTWRELSQTQSEYANSTQRGPGPVKQTTAPPYHPKMTVC